MCTYTHALSPYGCTHITEYITLHFNCLLFFLVMFSRLCFLCSILLLLSWQRLTNALFAFFYLITLFSGFQYTYIQKHQQTTYFQRDLRKANVIVEERNVRLTQSTSKTVAECKRLPRILKGLQSHYFTNARSHHDLHNHSCQH